MTIIESVGKGFSLSSKLLKVILIFFVVNFIMGLIALPFSGPENVGNPQAAAGAFAIGLLSVLVFVFIQGGALGLVRDLLKKTRSQQRRNISMVLLTSQQLKQ